MAILKTEGLILTSANWSESSQMLNVFTPNLGKISLSVKGSRRLNGKRGRPLKFARLELNCYIREGSESGYLSDVEPVEVFLFEKDGQLGRLTFASGGLELLNNLLTPHDPQPACYQISLSFFRMVDSIEKKRLPGLFAGYILRLISLLGFRPNLAGCVGCSKAAADFGPGAGERYFFSVERGGIICDDCRRISSGEAEIISLPAHLHVLALRLMESSLEEASQIPISLSDLTRLVNIIGSLLRFHAGTAKHLKSFDFLDKLIRAVEANGG